MSSLNKVLLIGRLGRDPEMRFTQDSKGVCSFSLATSKTWKTKEGEKKEKTTWHNIVAFGRLAEICAEFLKKGSLVFIEGSLNEQEYEDKETGQKKKVIKVQADVMQMLGVKDEKNTEKPEPGYAQYGTTDIPF